MGFWKKLLGVGEIAGGLVTGQPGLIATGAGTIAADSQNESIKSANQQQQQATQQAQGKLDQANATAQAAYAPYQQTGTGALSALNLGMGLQPLQPVAQPHSSVLQNGVPGQMAQRDPRNPSNTTFVPASNYTGEVAVPRSLATLAAESQTQSGYVQMQSPDGRVGRVPAAMVDRAVAAGGKVIGGVNG